MKLMLVTCGLAAAAMVVLGSPLFPDLGDSLNINLIGKRDLSPVLDPLPLPLEVCNLSQAVSPA